MLHDPGILEEGSAVNTEFVAPPACWIAAVPRKRPLRPFATSVVIGALYGVFVATGHQDPAPPTVPGSEDPMA